jgi:hypothetical protein
MQRAEERRALTLEVGDDGGFAAGQPFVARAALGRRRQQLCQMIGEIQRDAAVAIAQGLGADPRHLSGAEQGIQHRRRVIGDAGGQNFRVEH